MKTDCINEIAGFHIYSFAVIPDQICSTYKSSHYFSSFYLDRSYLEFRIQAVFFAYTLTIQKSRKQEKQNKTLFKTDCGEKKKTPLFPLLTPTLCQGYWLLYSSSFFFSVQLPVGKFWNSPPLHYMQSDIKDTVNAISLTAVVQLPSLGLKGSAFETLIVVV